MPDNEQTTAQEQAAATPDTDRQQTGQTGQPGADTQPDAWRPGDEPTGQQTQTDPTAQEPGQTPSTAPDDTADTPKDRSQSAGSGGF